VDSEAHANLSGGVSKVAARYDVILVDSIETARRLRAIEEYKYIPVVLLAPVVHVSLKSALELGITSYMTTPCLTIDLGNGMIPALENRAAPSLADNTKSFDILLAEDNIVNQRLAVKILEKYHHVVTVVGNGQEALDAIKDKRYDVILMDVQMPIMGGFEATAKIREYERSLGTQRTPIIALTAHAMLGDREKCIQAQMDEYLSKPLKQNHLIQTILKCATLGGALLEKGRDVRSSPNEEHPQALNTNGSKPSVASSSNSLLRPPMEPRPFSTTGPISHGSVESPAIVTADQDDPLSRVSPQLQL